MVKEKFTNNSAFNYKNTYFILYGIDVNQIVFTFSCI